jgi:hypothetical protein
MSRLKFTGPAAWAGSANNQSHPLTKTREGTQAGEEIDMAGLSRRNAGFAQIFLTIRLERSGVQEPRDSNALEVRGTLAAGTPAV